MKTLKLYWAYYIATIVMALVYFLTLIGCVIYIPFFFLTN